MEDDVEILLENRLARLNWNSLSKLKKHTFLTVADKKDLRVDPLTGALNVADALPIADDSASQTKKISPKVLIEQAFAD